MPVIGFLNSASPDLFAHLARAFCRALNQSNFVESRNFTLAAGQGLSWLECPQLANRVVRALLPMAAFGRSRRKNICTAPALAGSRSISRPRMLAEVMDGIGQDPGTPVVIVELRQRS